MNWSDQSQQTSFYLQMMEKRIKKNDILRIIDQEIDLSFIKERCKALYSDLGPTGYCPERLFRMLLVMYLDNIPSERKLVGALNVNIRYMWFCKIDLDSPVPDHPTFSVLRSRLGDAKFKEIFENILSQMITTGIVKPKSISVDSTSVLADVKIPEAPAKEGKPYKQRISPNDPDARYGHPSPKKGFFGYKAQMMVDNDTGTILHADAQPGSFDDKALNEEFIKEPIKDQNLKIKEAALDRGFDSYAIRQTLQAENIKAAIPLKRINDHNVFPLDRFTVNLKNKKAVCPAQRPMRYRGYDPTTRHHEFIAIGCAHCPLRTQCTTAQARRISVHQAFRLRQSARLFNRTEAYQKIFKKRGCVERVNAEAKRYHGLIRAKFRRLWKFKIQLYLTATVINLKRVAKYCLAFKQIGIAGP